MFSDGEGEMVSARYRVKGILFVDYVRMLRAHKGVDWSARLPAEDVPYLPVYHYQHIYAYRSAFEGFVPSPMPADIYRSVKGVTKQG